MTFSIRLAGFAAPMVLGLASAALAQTGTFLDRTAATNLRVAQFNVYNDSILTGTRRTKFARVAAATKPDVWAFQEMYNTPTADVLSLLNSVQPAAPGRSWNVYRLDGDEHVIASQFPVSLTASNTTPASWRSVAMAKIDLPDAQFATDLYLMNAHFKCCGGYDYLRQDHSDAFINWMRDARTPGGSINLAPGTAMMVMGDFNLVDGPQPLNSVLDGNIINNATYGSDSAPDWDGTANALADARQNAVAGGDAWTWRDDTGTFAPGRLDYITYTDSVLALQKTFALNTVAMTSAQRTAAGLQSGDTTVNASTGWYDHLPVFADFAGPLPGDLDGDLDRDATDIDLLFAATAGTTTGLNWRADVLRDGTINRTPAATGSDVDQLVKVLLNSNYGDATLDGSVNFDDLLALAQHYNTTGGWASGNFNGDASIDFNDLLALAQNYTSGASFASDWSLAQSLVPEPSVILAFTPLLAFRRRR